MDQERQQRRTDRDTRRAFADHAQDGIDQRRQQSGIGHDPEEQDREDEHAGDRRDLGKAIDDVTGDAGRYAGCDRARDRDQDQRRQRRYPVGQDDGEQRQDGRCGDKSQYDPLPYLFGVYA